jgi:ribosomal protein S12 methylthiotransferase
MRFHLLALGCPKNTVDSEGIEELLRHAGHLRADDPQEADLLIVNTCGFIDLAIEESLLALREMAKAKRPGQYLLAAGCLSQRYGASLTRKVPGIDAIIGTQRWPEIIKIVDALAQREPPVQLPASEARHVASHPIPRLAQGCSAYIKIADGCSAPCAFCVIPQIKGPYISKPQEVVLEEARQLVAQGVKEIILIGQDTTAYGYDWDLKDGLPDLMQAILKATPEVGWLRLMYTYPTHVTPRLIEVMATSPQVCHYLDLPLQHAHPEVLKRMKRPHSLERTRKLIADLREAMPDMALRTSFIVGYPGETEQEFRALLEFIQEVTFDRLGVFTYSREEGTEAASLPHQLPQEVREERRVRTMALQQDISRRKNRAFMGKELRILIEGVAEGISVGRSYRDAPEVDGMVLAESRLPVNEFAPVRVTGALEYDLIASPCTI